MRTGLDVGGISIEHYEDGSGEDDPALVWYVDLRLDDDHGPQNPDDARRWLIDHASLVTDTYRLLADKLEVGVDPDVWPLKIENPTAIAGVRMAAVCSCTRRVPALTMRATVQGVAEHWREYLQSLFQVQHQ
jgi:hypothetical protein